MAHTGAYIRKVVDEVLGESEVYSSKVLASLTDNGSNMVTVFRVQLHAIQDDEEDEDKEEKTEEQESKEQVLDFGDESIDFEDRECDQAIVFHSLGLISCFAHTLQLVVNMFSKITGSKLLIQSVLNHAHSRQKGKLFKDRSQGVS